MGRRKVENMGKAVAACLLFCFIGAATAFPAFDQADNDPYPARGYAEGANGGTGFTAWVSFTAENSGGEYLSDTALTATNDYSWQISGLRAMGRGLSSSLAAGKWTFLARHDSANTHFSGFNLKGSTNAAAFAEDELLRFGMDGNRGSGIVLSLDGGQTYQFLDCGWIDGAGDVLQYEISWNGPSGTYALTVSNLTEQVGASFSGTLSVFDSVAMLGTAVLGSSLDERLSYDQFLVVPEARAAALLLPSIVTILFLRRRLIL